MGKQSPLVEVDARLGRRPRDVGVRGKVHDGVVTARCLDERLQVLDVRTNDREAPVAGAPLEVDLASRREVVVDRHCFDGCIREQAVDQVTADEARPADDEPASVLRTSVAQRSDSHFAV